jgi:hypothetical protein
MNKPAKCMTEDLVQKLTQPKTKLLNVVILGLASQVSSAIMPHTITPILAYSYGYAKHNV